MQVVYVVTGGTEVGRLAQRYLEQAGFAVNMLSAESDVIQRAERFNPALIAIDATIANHGGLELCGAIRANRSLARTPVILFADKTSEEERVRGLELGADDYIAQLSSGSEFVARVRAVIRRLARPPRSRRPLAFTHFPSSLERTPAPLKTGDIEIDTSAMRILVRGGEIETTRLEFRLMYYLTHHRTRVFTRDQLLDAVWGTQYANPRLVDACVRRLRRKIEPNRARPTYLKTVRGAGYCLAA